MKDYNNYKQLKNELVIEQSFHCNKPLLCVIYQTSISLISYSTFYHLETTGLIILEDTFHIMVLNTWLPMNSEKESNQLLSPSLS
jgi:hypothetical protein